MSWRTTGSLVALVGMLAVILVVATRDHPTTIPANPPPLLTVAIADVASVELSGAGGDMRVERSGAGWRGGTAAQHAAMASLLATLATIRPLMVVADDPADPGEFGLDSDALRLVVRTDDRTVLDLEIGDRNPAWTALYARRVGNRRVLLVGGVLHWELAKLLAPADEADRP